MNSDIEWYMNDDVNAVTYDTWMLPVSAMNISDTEINLLEPPTVSPATERLLADEDAFPSYAHFNTAYPFIGVDSNVGAMILDDLQQVKASISCDAGTNNPWGVCYYSGKCNTNLFADKNLQFTFGSNTMFALPVSSLMIDYESYN